MRLPSLWKTLLGLYLCAYLAAGAYTETKFIQIMPLPEHWMEDFGFYQRAMNNALTGHDPYGSRLIGVAYLYPPPALLVIEIFGHIQPQEIQGALFLGVNLLLMTLMIASLAVLYKLSFRQTWWWYVLCFGFAPFIELLHIGQINVVVMFGLFLLFYYEATSPAASGLGLGLAAATKVSPLFFFGYLFANRKYKVMAFALVAILLLAGAAVLRYGPQPTLDYPGVFRWLLDQQQLDSNSQSLVAKLAVADTPEYQRFLAKLPDFLQRPVNWPFAYASLHPDALQRILTIYLLGLTGLSCLLTCLGRQDREATFIVTTFAMVLSPNIVWYHHYVFLLLPILIWIAWSKFKPTVIAWCLLGALVIQVDRYLPPYGLLIHIFGHLSLLALLVWQIRDILARRKFFFSLAA
ncbi:MAG: glycosyltransferase family 87 protein [Chloroflexota bacterium]